MDYVEIILKRVCKEMEEIAMTIQNGKFDDTLLERLDKLAHTKKSLLTVKAMEDAEEYMEESGESENGSMSGRRGRNPSTGRYMSRSDGYSQRSYADGYSRGYSEAMKQNMQSGHWPPVVSYEMDRYRY